MESMERYKKIFRQLRLPFDPNIAGKIDSYINLLKKWNVRVNLIASNEWSLIEPLLLEGLWAARFYPEDSGTHLDIGSGAGFPAIPLRIMVPRLKMDMVDSRLKRISFLETVINRLNLAESSASHGRINDFLIINNKKWDCISWKGLKIQTKDLLQIVQHTHRKTEIWMFHGNQLASEEPEKVDEILTLVRREKFPFKSEWMLSIYRPQ